MQNGSIVVVKKLPEIDDEVKKHIKWLPKDDEKTPYMLRDEDVDNRCERIFRFEEGVIGYVPYGKQKGLEFALPESLLREILPPQETSILDEILEPEEIMA